MLDRERMDATGSVPDAREAPPADSSLVSYCVSSVLGMMAVRLDGSLVRPLLLAVSWAVSTSCTNGPEGCDSKIFEIEVPAQRAGDVAYLTQSGPGCGDGTPYCADGKSPCLVYATRHVGGWTFLGDCRVTVTFKSGAPPFVATATFAPEPGCTRGSVSTPKFANVPSALPVFDGGKG